MDSIQFLGVLFLSIGTLKISEGAIEIFPQNTADLTELETRLQCKLSGGDPVWAVSKDRGFSYTNIAAGETVIGDNPHYRVEVGINGEYTLVIVEFIFDDVGLYKCADILGSQDGLAYAIALNNMACTVNYNLTAEVVEGDSLEMQCTLPYRGLWAPIIQWTSFIADAELPVTNVDNATSDILVSYTAKHVVTQNDGGRIFQANLMFESPPNGAIPDVTPENVFYSMNAPGYTQGTDFSPLIVHFSPRNLQLDYIKEEYNPGDVVTCTADGSPTPSIQWINDETNNTLDTHRLVITEEMEGDGRSFTCTAFNEIRGEALQVSQTLTFIVTIPTTTTPSPTTSAATTILPTTDEPSGSSGGLTTGTIVGIVLGILFSLLLIFVLFFFCCIRKAPTKAKDNKKKSHMDGVDAIRPAQPGKPADISYIAERPPPYNQYNPYAPPADRNVEGLMYGDMALDDTPRSRKPIQVYEPTNYDDIRRV